MISGADRQHLASDIEAKVEVCLGGDGWPTADSLRTQTSRAGRPMDSQGGDDVCTSSSNAAANCAPYGFKLPSTAMAYACLESRHYRKST